MTTSAEILEADSSAEQSSHGLGWIYTIEGCRSAHHVYLSFPRDASGQIVKAKPRPVVSKKGRIGADLISTCLWHPVEQRLYAYGVCLDIDILGTAEANLDERGCIDADLLRQYLNRTLGPLSPLFKMVRSTSGRGIHLWLFFPAFPLNTNEAKHEKQRAMATKIQKAMRLHLRSGGFAADFRANGLHHLYANWRNPDKMIDRDIPFLQAKVRRAIDDERTRYSRILSIVYDDLKRREELKSVFVAELKKLYRDSRISAKLMAFALANHGQLKAGDTIRLRCSELLAALGISKNSLPKLIADVTADAPTLGIRIERDLLSPGYYLVTRGIRFDGIPEPHKAKFSVRKGTKTNSIDVIEPLKFPEQVCDGERNHEVCKAILKLKLHGVEAQEAFRIASIYAHRAIDDQNSITIKRIKDYVTNIYTNHSDNKGKMPGLAPNWLLTITTRPYPKSLKRELQSCFPGDTGRPDTAPGPLSDQAEGTDASPLAGSAEAVGARALVKNDGKPFSRKLSEALKSAEGIGQSEKVLILETCVQLLRDQNGMRDFIEELGQRWPDVTWPALPSTAEECSGSHDKAGAGENQSPGQPAAALPPTVTQSGDQIE